MVIQHLTPELEAVSQALLAGLDQSGVRVTAAFWNYFEDLGGWRFGLEMPDLVSEGPAPAYARIRQVLQEKRLSGLTIGEMVIARPANWHTKLLRKLVRLEGTGRVRVSNSVVNGHVIQDAVIYRLVPESMEPGSGTRLPNPYVR
jgi:hypothetical protein